MTKRKLSCHCGAVRIELTFQNGVENPSRCSCSMCRRRGAVMGSVPLDALKVTSGEDKLSVYSFNTGTAKHYFCSVCGIYTHHQQRFDPATFGFNVECLEGIEPFSFQDAPVFDGVNHPSDR